MWKTTKTSLRTSLLIRYDYSLFLFASTNIYCRMLTPPHTHCLNRSLELHLHKTSSKIFDFTDAWSWNKNNTMLHVACNIESFTFYNQIKAIFLEYIIDIYCYYYWWRTWNPDGVVVFLTSPPHRRLINEPINNIHIGNATISIRYVFAVLIHPF